MNDYLAEKLIKQIETQNKHLENIEGTLAKISKYFSQDQEPDHSVYPLDYFIPGCSIKKDEQGEN